MLKKRMTMKKKTANPTPNTPAIPSPSPLVFMSNLVTDNGEEPTIEKPNIRAHRGLCPSFLKRRGLSSSKGMLPKRGGGTKKTPTNGGVRTFIMGKAGGKSDDDTEVDTDSDSGITENGVFTRFFGGDEETSNGSLETTSVFTSEEADNESGGFWDILHCSMMCGNCA